MLLLKKIKKKNEENIVSFLSIIQGVKKITLFESK